MKKLVFLAVLALSGVASASEEPIGTIISTGTSVTNATTTGTTFTIEGPKQVSVQCDAAAHVRQCDTSSCTVTASTGVKVNADGLYDIKFATTSKRWVAVISVSGTANCDVFNSTSSL